MHLQCGISVYLGLSTSCFGRFCVVLCRTNQQLQTQIQDKVAELEAANKRTTSLLSQQNQLQMSMKVCICRIHFCVVGM